MRNVLSVLFVMGFTFCSSQETFALSFSDGGLHDIDYQISESVSISDESFWHNPTTVNFLSGSYLSRDKAYIGLGVYGNSFLKIQGGSISSTITIEDNSTATVEAGNLDAFLMTNRTARLTISGGTFSNFSTSFHDSSSVVINGGSFYTTPYYSFGSNDYASVSVTGGTFSCDSNFRVSVGNYSKMLISGGIDYIYHLSLSDNSQTTIKGTDIKINGVDVPSGSYSGTREGFMTGILLDGTQFEYNVTINNNAILTVQNIPEPATLALFSLGGLLLRRKKLK